MSNRVQKFPTEPDDRNEGARPVQEPRDPMRSRHQLTIPATKVRGNRSPAGETGLMPAVRVQAESMDNNDAQDASRTTAEVKPSPAPQPAANLQPRAKPLALIVEDTAPLAELIQITLDRLNLDTVVESHGVRALARFYELKPDIVLLDLGLPDINGWKVLESIKEGVGAGGTMPVVIVITAYGDAANRLVGKFQNVYSYLVKPFTGEEVASVVTSAMNGKVG